MEGYLYDSVNSGVVAISAANGLTFAPDEPVQIIRFGCIVTIATTVAASIITGNHQAAGGGALVPSGAGDLGSVTVPISVAGKGFYKQMASPFLVLPGEQVQLVSDGGATAGSGIVFAHFKRMNFQNYTVDRGTYDALTTPADTTQLANLTLVTV